MKTYARILAVLICGLLPAAAAAGFNQSQHLNARGQAKVNKAIARGVKALIATLGAQGSLIYAGGKRYEIPAVKAEQVVDPTGCGDAYRAGLLYGIAKGWSWDDTGRLASLMGSIKIAHRGAQNHNLSRGEIDARFKRAFGHSPPGA